MVGNICALLAHIVSMPMLFNVLRSQCKHKQVFYSPAKFEIRYYSKISTNVTLSNANAITNKKKNQQSFSNPIPKTVQTNPVSMYPKVTVLLSQSHDSIANCHCTAYYQD